MVESDASDFLVCNSRHLSSDKISLLDVSMDKNVDKFFDNFYNFSHGYGGLCSLPGLKNYFFIAS